MSKYTTVQWSVAKYSKTDIIAEDGTMIASAREGLNGVTHEQAVEHAKLIAAAPKLLVALEELLKHVPVPAVHMGDNFSEPFPIPEYIANARAAIEEAKN